MTGSMITCDVDRKEEALFKCLMYWFKNRIFVHIGVMKDARPTNADGGGLKAKENYCLTKTHREGDLS